MVLKKYFKIKINYNKKAILIYNLYTIIKNIKFNMTLQNPIKL